MLVSIVQNVYIDIDWVAKEYLHSCSKGCWKGKNAAESLKCWNLERVIDAELRKVVPSGETTLVEFVAETEGAEVNEEI